MKKQFQSLLAITFLLLANGSSFGSPIITQYALKPLTIAAVSNEEPGEPVSSGNVNIKVMRSFNQSYGEQQSVKWYRSARGFIAAFENDGVKNLVHYNANGTEESKMTSYFEKNLSPEIRHLVKSNFYDYTILYVNEVKKNDATAFYVKMQDSTKIKTIKIVDGEWEVVEDLSRR